MRLKGRTVQLPVQGYKPRGWALKRSTYRCQIMLQYTLVQEGFYSEELHEWIPKKTRTQKLLHQFTANGIWGGRYGKVKNEIMGKYNASLEGFIKQDLEDFAEYEPDWEVEDVEVVNITLERLD